MARSTVRFVLKIMWGGIEIKCRTRKKILDSEKNR